MPPFKFSPTPSRSENMRRIKAKDTSPEIAVRKICRELGYRGYRIHRKDLPGKPDIAYIGRKLAIFVNGCFWHGHDCPIGIRKPKTNRDYWLPKIERNRRRDSANIAELCSSGWKVLVVWECELKNLAAVSKKIRSFLVS